MNSEQELKALIVASAPEGDSLNAARGIGWSMLIMLCVVIVGMCVALGVR